VRRTKRVPELTRNVGINLNERLLLRRKAKAIAWSAPDIAPIRTQHSEAAGRLYSARRLCFLESSPTIADSDNHTVMMDLSPQPAWAEAWHLWTVVFPRRSITGRLVYGKVWRRHDGRRWRYKKFTEFRIDRDH
jgi:hypothetical protein